MEASNTNANITPKQEQDNEILRKAIMEELNKRIHKMNHTALECIYLWICRA